jgi:hypothetical protein
MSGTQVFNLCGQRVFNPLFSDARRTECPLAAQVKNLCSGWYCTV